MKIKYKGYPIEIYKGMPVICRLRKPGMFPGKMIGTITGWDSSRRRIVFFQDNIFNSQGEMMNVGYHLVASPSELTPNDGLTKMVIEALIEKERMENGNQGKTAR